MASSANIEYTLLFEDDTTQKLTVGPYDPDYISQSSNLASLKANIKSFLATCLTDDVKSTAISKYGANWIGFSKVQVVVSEREVIF